MPTLLLTSRYTEDAQLLWRAASRSGWRVERVRGISLPEDLEGEIVLFVEALLAPTLAEQLGIELLEPAETWLAELPDDFKRRQVSAVPLAAARRMPGPVFAKPPNDKSFEAKVYASGSDLPQSDEDRLILVAEPVQWTCEFRCFCLDGSVLTLSPYLRSGRLARQDDFWASEEELQTARELAETVLALASLPRAVALDVGQIDGRGWAVVEANGAWASGIYGCVPELALRVIRAACLNPSDKRR